MPKVTEELKEQFKADCKALCEKYIDTLGILLIAQEDIGDEVFIHGNLCPRCADEILTHYIDVKNIEHFGDGVHTSPQVFENPLRKM